MGSCAGAERSGVGRRLRGRRGLLRGGDGRGSIRMAAASPEAAGAGIGKAFLFGDYIRTGSRRTGLGRSCRYRKRDRGSQRGARRDV